MTGRDFVTGRRAVLPLGLAALRGDLALAAFAFVLLSLFGAFVAFSPSEWAISQTPEADERQRTLNDQAIQLAYFAVITVAIIGFGSEVWRGDSGSFTLVCTVGGFTHMAALAVLRRRSVSGGSRPEA